MTVRAPRRELEKVAEEAARCTNCDLYKHATQTVFGEGPSRARLMLVGEQPGDKEDVAGRPFVGPAGRLLAEVLEEVGLDRRRVYLTNAVKHFKFVQRPGGKVRLHKTPSRGEVEACHPWLERELEIVRPDVVALLGATAAQAVLGSSFRVTKHRREWVEWDRQPLVTATVHPSSVLRSDDRPRARAAFVDDLRFVAQALAD